MSRLGSRRIDASSMMSSDKSRGHVRCKPITSLKDRTSIGSPLPPVSPDDGERIDGSFPSITVHRASKDFTPGSLHASPNNRNISKSPMAKRKIKQESISKIKTQNHEFPLTMDFSKLNRSPSPSEPWSPGKQSQNSLLSLSHPLYERSKDGKSLLHFASTSSLSASKSEGDIASEGETQMSNNVNKKCPLQGRGLAKKLTPLKLK